MELLTKLREDLKSAMKAGDTVRLGTLRFLMAQAQGREKEKQGKGLEPKLTDGEFIEVLQKEAKKRKEAIALYQQGNRDDLVQKEQAELVVIQSYLPAQMSEAEVRALVATLRAEGLSDFGALMKEATKRAAGRADGKMMAEIIKAG